MGVELAPKDDKPYKYSLEALTYELEGSFLDSEYLRMHAKPEAFQAIQRVMDGTYGADVLEIGGFFAAEVLSSESLTVAVGAWMVKNEESVLAKWREEDKRYFLGLIISKNLEPDKRVLAKHRLIHALYATWNQDEISLDRLEAEIRRREEIIKKLSEKV